MKTIPILIIRFKNALNFAQIATFRGAVNSLLEADNLLFHNHTAEGLRYAYPLIQYKSFNRHAAMVCICEGTECIGEFFSRMNHDLCFGGSTQVLELDAVKAENILVQVWDSEFTYHLRRWLPLNADNYALYRQTDSLKDRLAQLEKILIGNILSFAKGVGIHFERNVSCSILNIEELHPLLYKGVSLSAFDVQFKTNVSIPGLIGLGKGASHGFGVVVRKIQ